MRPDFLTGTIDLHVHSRPDVVDRVGSAIELARDAAAAHMRAIVFKDHIFPSFIKAELAREVVPDIELFGGICLNNSVGGLNEYTVKAAIKAGAKVVMFPTLDARWNIERPHKPLPQRLHSLGEVRVPVPVTDDAGNLVPAAEAVLKVVAGHPDVVLSNGHIGAGETVALMERARQLGIRRMVVEHPNQGDHFREEHLFRLKEAGALLALSFNAYHPAIGARKLEESIQMIRLVGAEHCALITDGGQTFSPRPVETMRFFCEMLYEIGLTVDELFTMTKVTPARLLGLPESPA